MSNCKERGRFGRRLLFASAALGVCLAASAAFAGECPADQRSPTREDPVDFKPVGVTDTVIASINVAEPPYDIKDRNFRMPKLTIEPMGVVPWHSHADRPAIIYIVEGEINEYASNCAVPIVHKAGDVVAETPEVSHWWKNVVTRPLSCSPPICSRTRTTRTCNTPPAGRGVLLSPQGATSILPRSTASLRRRRSSRSNRNRTQNLGDGARPLRPGLNFSFGLKLDGNRLSRTRIFYGWSLSWYAAPRGALLKVGALKSGNGAPTNPEQRDRPRKPQEHVERQHGE